jgi:hypothetical protein
VAASETSDVSLAAARGSETDRHGEVEDEAKGTGMMGHAAADTRQPATSSTTSWHHCAASSNETHVRFERSQRLPVRRRRARVYSRTHSAKSLHCNKGGTIVREWLRCKARHRNILAKTKRLMRRRQTSIDRHRAQHPHQRNARACYEHAAVCWNQHGAALAV